MAGRLTTATLLFLLAGGAEAGENLPDPTRPPPGFDVPPAAAGTVPGTSVPAGQPPGLQTVILRRQGGRSTAVINGESVRLGDKIGDKKLVKISETEVVLVGPQGRETLRLIPDVDKKPSVASRPMQEKRQ